MAATDQDDKLYGVLEFDAYKTKHHVVIPFVCQRCGKCCREMGVDPAPGVIELIRRHLKLDFTQFVERYVGHTKTLADGSLGYVPTKCWRPCPFLTSSNACEIYEARPSVCCSFPLETDFGDSGIGCPGLKLFRAATGALRSGRGGELSTGQGAFPHFEPEDDWIYDSTCAKLRRRRIPGDFIAELVAANGWDVALATGRLKKCPRRRRLT